MGIPPIPEDIVHNAYDRIINDLTYRNEIEERFGERNPDILECVLGYNRTEYDRDSVLPILYVYECIDRVVQVPQISPATSTLLSEEAKKITVTAFLEMILEHIEKDNNNHLLSYLREFEEKECEIISALTIYELIRGEFEVPETATRH